MRIKLSIGAWTAEFFIGWPPAEEEIEYEHTPYIYSHTNAQVEATSSEWTETQHFGYVSNNARSNGVSVAAPNEIQLPEH